mgnify:CR=1 FL=1
MRVYDMGVDMGVDGQGGGGMCNGYGRLQLYSAPAMAISLVGCPVWWLVPMPVGRGDGPGFGSP